jgi:hypothetical protein
LGKSNLYVKGSKNKNANIQRNAFNVKGGTHSLTRRPVIAFPAQSNGGTVKRAAVLRLKGGFTDEDNGKD